MKVRVVGAGVVGLTSAWRLAEAGHRVEVVTAALPEHTTSSVAAALWYPYRAYPEADVTRWCGRSYTVLAGFSADARTGVRLRVGRELFREPTADPWWRTAVPGLARMCESQLPTGYVDAYELTVPVIDMGTHLGWLVDRLRGLAVGIAVERLDDLSSAFGSADAVVNCTGLGSRTLADDETLSPVRGQVVVVEQFGLTEWVLDQTAPESLTYVVPRADTVILGGTADEGDDDLSVRPATSAAIVRRCTALIPEVADARIVAVRVGVRPARPAVRLGTEIINGRPVVHCYGHGGAGVTLSYGCAEEVVEHVSALA